MEQEIRPITFNIYASSDEEAEKGRKAIIKFINIIGQQGAKVTGNKIADAVAKLNSSPFVTYQIINFFKKQ